MPPDPQFGGNNNVSERQLSWGLWFVAHRGGLKRIGYGALIAVAVVSWAYTLWGVVDHFFVRGLDLQRAIQRDLAVRQNPRAAIIQRQRAKPLEIAEVSLLPTSASTFDAAARVVNPNPRWVATVEYQLDVPGAPSELMRTVLLPGRERWLVRLNAESKTNPTATTLTFRSVDWQRLSHLEAADPKRFIDERLSVDVKSPVFVSPRELMFGGGTPLAGSPVPTVQVSRATFIVANRSAYGLRDLELAVLLRRGPAIVGVNRIVLNDLRAGEERAAAATWFQPLGLVQAVEVVPYVNVFDPRAFIEL
ncbi:MAG: hypothetical protein Q7R80_01150 [bacterium]|nr:hypothetical protein [bacterium]